MSVNNKLIKLNGIIIGESNYRDFDKLLTILTKERGKIKVYAFNVRRSNSKKIGTVRIFTFGEFELIEDKDSYSLQNIILKESFDNLTLDYNNTCYASYFIELADYFGFENLESEKICDLIYYTFKALVRGAVDAKLIRRVFELKMLEFQGEYKDSESLSVDNKTLKYTWDFILNTLSKDLYTFKLSDDIYKLFDSEMSLEMRDKVGKKFKSLEGIE